MDGFFSQFPNKCHLKEVASVGDCLKICPQFNSRVKEGTLISTRWRVPFRRMPPSLFVCSAQNRYLRRVLATWVSCLKKSRASVRLWWVNLQDLNGG